jgi:hypothetical protein
VPKGSDDFKAYLTSASEQNDAIFKKYRRYIAGMYARLYQGRCQMKLDNFKDALSYFDELMANPGEDEDTFRLKVEATLYAAECWMQPSATKYDVVVQKGRDVIEKAPPHEQRDEELLKLRMLVIRAAKSYAEELRKKDPKDPQIATLLGDARKYAQFVARLNSDYQKEAQKLLGELGGAAPSTTQIVRRKYKDFDEAKKAALDAYEETKAPKLTIDSLSEQLPETKDPAEKKELEKRIADAKIAYEQGVEQTRQITRDALALTDSESNIDEINNLRNLFCFLLYQQGRYYDAATIGDFVARRYPDASGARVCAKIAMASYLKVYQETKADSKPIIDRFLEELDKDSDGRISLEELQAATPELQARLSNGDVNQDKKLDNAEMVRLLTRFESDRIVDICNYITQKWSDQTEAQEALGTLIGFMISEGQLAKAEDYLSKIPTDSPQRGTAELKIGQALWAAYTRGMKQAREQEESATSAGTDPGVAKQQSAARREELKEVKNRAEKTLAEGVQRMENSGKIDPVLTSAVLSLASVWIDINQPVKSVTLLENPKIGLLKLVADNHESIDREGFREEVFKTALRAYISSLSVKEADSKVSIQKASEMMDRLKQTMGTSPAGQKALIAVYVSLAKELEQQINLAPDETRDALIQGFKTFLDQVGAGSNELNVLYWVASTYGSMAESNPQSKSAGENYKRAISTYQSILDKAGKKELTLDAAMKNQITLQLARTKRASGDYDGAIGLLKEILASNAVLLPVQIEAAKTFQDWGSKDAKKYVSASSGAFPEGKKGNTVWGWGLIANRVAGKPNFHNQFYEARYNAGVCQYRYALAQKDDNKEKFLKMAKTTLVTTVDLYPNLQGDGSGNQRDFTQDYDALMRLLQRQLREPETGLAGALKEKTGAKGQPATAKGPPAPTSGSPSSPTTPPSSTKGLPGATKGLPGATKGLPGATQGLPGAPKGPPGASAAPTTPAPATPAAAPGN